MGALFPEERCRYAIHPIKERKVNGAEEILAFAETHSFFSPHHPLIGVVTHKEQDIWRVADLFKMIVDQVPLADQPFMTQEALTKVLAYRELEEGRVLLIPFEGKLIRYRVDAPLHLDRGMPAYGLVPEDNKAPSFLLFRGTELSWKGRRSIASDLDWEGVGYRCFIKASPKIEAWLRASSKVTALGYSLGGIFAAYTLLFYPELVEGACAFDPPGLGSKGHEQWEEKQLDERFTVYVTRGDCVSKYGKLVGRVHELSIDEKLLPITAHTLFISAQPTYFIARVFDFK